ncbi:MAG: hypothetical protein HND44_16820 [Chloroflexi bacterium]|nr:hypothetical protein [Ardenticatenaceae bacterium]MBL1130121.1 hypothetical protein [Chloroflexota bacterium]NOG36208.1 hypothetical protein [Chloroflexota bacterium]GIK56262.1 MAG: hypothetical protein BroJett015_19250 [Chloroflexota bacterium]
MVNGLTDDLLNEYLDGELNETERQEVAAAITRSPEAQTRLAELEALFAAFTDMPDVPLPADLTPGVLASLTRPAPSPHWLRLLPLTQVVAAALLVVLFWGALQSWWTYGRALLPTPLPPVALPDVGEWISGWVTAVTNLSLPSIQFNLALYQWAILISLALIIWLLGARLLFTEPGRPSGRHFYEK